MHKLIHIILNNYKEEIKVVEDSNLGDFNTVEQGISISRQYLQKLRICEREHEFVDKQNEIIFFKNHKPYIDSRLKFYANLYNLVINRPAAHLDGITSIISKHLFFSFKIDEC